jgi:protein-disulfide isomerase/uncharacterized membrane protein
VALNRILLVLAFAGMFASGVLAIGVLMDLSPPCGAAGGCDLVSAHPVARPFGVPLAYVGFVAYALIAGITFVRGIRPHLWPRLASLGALITGAGAMASLALTLFSMRVIGALCAWCVVSAVVMLLLLSGHLLLSREAPGPGRREPLLLAALLLATAVALFWQGSAMVLDAKRPGGDAARIARTPWDVLAPPDAASIGPAEAGVVAVQFTDLTCSACRQMHAATHELLRQTDPNLRIVLRHLPLVGIPGHEAARDAAVLAEIAGEEGRLWDYVDRVFVEPAAPNRERLLELMAELEFDRKGLEARLADPADPALRRVLRDEALAERLGIAQTPTFVILANGIRPEALPPAGFRERINQPDLRGRL